MIEKDLASLQHPNLAAVIGIARRIDTSSKVVLLHDGSEHPYDKLCICTGALPKVRCFTSNVKSIEHSAAQMHYFSSSKARACSVQAVAEGKHVLVLRDRDTVESLARRMRHARRIAVVGNGGIAMELAFSLHGVEVHCCCTFTLA